MYKSNNFKITTFHFENKISKMEYELKLRDNSYTGFGNIYFDGENEEPKEFTFSTINGRVAIYSPMNAKIEYIAAIVKTVTGISMPVDKLI